MIVELLEGDNLVVGFAAADTLVVAVEGNPAVGEDILLALDFGNLVGVVDSFVGVG